MRFCVWFWFSSLTIKWRCFCLALKQSSPLSNLCPISDQLDAGISPDSFLLRKQFFQLCKSCAWCTAGFAAAAAQQSVVWCGVAASFRKVAKNEKIVWFVPIWTRDRRLWWDPKTWVTLQGCQDQSLHLIIYKVPCNQKCVTFFCHGASRKEENQLPLFPSFLLSLSF